MDSISENVNSCMLFDAFDFSTAMHNSLSDFTYQLYAELPPLATFCSDHYEDDVNICIKRFENKMFGSLHVLVSLMLRSETVKISDVAELVETYHNDAANVVSEIKKRYLEGKI